MFMQSAPLLVSASALRNALKSARALVDRTGLHPIYQFARWTLEPEHLAIRATDGDTEIVWRVPHRSKSVGGCSLRPLASTEGIEPLDILVDIRSALTTLPRGSRASAEMVTITNHTSRTVCIGSHRNAGGLAFAYPAPTEPAAEIKPVIWDIEYDAAQASKLRRAIRYALLATSDDLRTRLHMAAVILAPDGHVFGTDGNRLHATSGLRSFEPPATRADGISIPLQAARCLVDLVSDPTPITLGLTRSGTIETLTAATPLGEVRTEVTTNWVPPYQEILPKNQPAKFTIVVKKLRDALDTASNAVRFTAGDDQGSVICTPGRVGLPPESPWIPELPIQIPGRVRTRPGHVPCIQVSSDYLLEAVTECAGDIVTITSAGPLDPIVVHDGDRRGIVMPLRR